MNDFYTKWKNDKKYRTKIKLLAYTIFVLIVSAYALSINKNTSLTNNDYNNTSTNDYNTSINESNSFSLPEIYSYNIDININDKYYNYYGNKTLKEKTIIKQIDEEITNYRYLNNEYYILIDNNYIKTTKDEVYDIVNYNYINIDNINAYLTKAKKNANEYTVYLKDVILGYDSTDYFTITINNNFITIDYTNLMKQFDRNIEKYLINIKIEKEWKRWKYGK